MSSRSPYPKSCIDCGTPVVTRYAVRCKSCAAKKRLRDKPNALQLAEARANSRPWFAGATFRPYIPTLVYALRKDRREIWEVEKAAGLYEGAIPEAIRHGRCTLATAVKLCRVLGVGLDVITEAVA